MHRSRIMASVAVALAALAAPSACAVAGPVPPSSMPLSPVGTPLTMQASGNRYTKPRAKGRHCTSLRRRKP